MRTTLDMDDDVLEAVKKRARAEKKSVGRVISDLVRLALTGSTNRAHRIVVRNGIVVAPHWQDGPPGN